MPAKTLNNIILVTLVTFLIWVYAESESLRTEDMAATVVFSAAPGSGRAVWLIDSPGRPIMELKLRLEGATAAIDALRRHLHTTIPLTPGGELPMEPAQHSIDLRSALRASPVFAKSGVTIAEVTPATVSVLVDELVTRQVPVRVELPPGTETTGPPEVQPAQATITFPRTLLQALNDLPALASLDRASLTPLTPGRLQRLPGVPIQAPATIRDQPYVSMDPKAATVTVTLRDQTASIDLPTVPVQIRMSPVAYAEWDVDIPEDSRFLRDVRVTGPSDLIAQIREGKMPVIAYVSLTPEDLTRGALSGGIFKEAVFSDLPIPNNPLEFDVEDRAVRVSIQKRTHDPGERPTGPNGPPPGP
jgi:hypothetical protein